MLNYNRFWYFIFLQSVLIAQSRDIKFEHYSLEEGLSQTQVNCIIQDREGFLWICTYDGLNQYNGYNFNTFYHDPFDSNSISSNDINCIYEDKKGILWIGTYNNGVDIFDKTTNQFHHINYNLEKSDDLRYKNILTIMEDKDGFIWMGTQGGGLIKYDRYKNKFIHYKNNPNDSYSLSNNVVYTIIGDRHGTLWIGTADGLNIFDRRTKRFLNYKNSEGVFLKQRENYISNLYLDKQNNLWVGANHYLARLDRSKNKFQNFDITFKGRKEVQGYRIWSIVKDKSGTLWIGTTRGLIKFNEQQNQYSIYCNDPLDPYSLSNNYVWSLIQDYSGNIWAGTDIGINKFTLENKKFLLVGGRRTGSTLDRLTYVWSIFQDRKNNVWIGTENGLYRWNRKSGECIEYKHAPTNKNSICNNLVYSISGDSKDNIWLATLNGLDRYDYITNKFFHYTKTPGWKKYIADNVIYKIFIDHKGLVWLGVDKVGLVQYNPKTGTLSGLTTNSTAEISKYLATAIRFFEDSEHNVWIGSASGLIKFIRNDNRFVIYRHDPSNPNTISSNIIMSIFEDHKGNLWIGTDGKGFNYFDKKKEIFKCYLVKDGLPSNTIYGVLEDRLGNLWLSSNNGLSKFNPDNMSITNFDVSDGLQSKEFNAGAFFKNNQGEMFFGGINGLNIFHPDSIKYNTHIPQVVITEIKIMNQRIQEAPVLTSGILEVSYSQNFISFQFAALDLTNPNKNNYKYKMEGFDKNWIVADGKRFVDYTNLDPGEYTFKVIASNNDGAWNLAGTSLSLIVLPPYWMTWWFRTAAVIFIFSIFFGLYRMKIKRLLEIEKLRFRIASDLHDEVGASLTSLSIQTQLLNSELDKKRLDQKIGIIEELSRKVIGMMSDIVWSIDSRNDSMQNMIDRMKDFSSQILNDKNIQVEYDITLSNPDKKISLDARHNIYLIYKEAINNIAKHSNANNVEIRISNNLDMFEMSVRDDGIGNKAEEHNHGNGMRNMALRAEKIKGKIDFVFGNGLLIKLVVNKL